MEEGESGQGHVKEIDIVEVVVKGRVAGKETIEIVVENAITSTQGNVLVAVTASIVTETERKAVAADITRIATGIENARGKEKGREWKLIEAVNGRESVNRIGKQFTDRPDTKAWISTF